VKCPECGADMVLRETKKYRHKDGKPRKFYGCERWPECNGTHGAHPDGRPLGNPADAETKKARREAHKALECAYPKAKTGTIYKNIQRLMGLSEEDAHIGKFTKEQCINLIELLNGGKG